MFILQFYAQAKELAAAPMNVTIEPTYFISFPTDDPDFTTSGDFETTLSPELPDLSEAEQLKLLLDRVEELQSNQEALEHTLLYNISSLDVVLDTISANLEALKPKAGAETGATQTKGRRRRGSSTGTFDFGVSNNTEHRINWDAYHPMLISEGLFAVAKVMSFLRPIALTVMNRHVGPMQISLGGMIFDISKFLLIFSFVWFAFSLGMNQLFWYYSRYMKDICLEQGTGLNCRPPFGT